MEPLTFKPGPWGHQYATTRDGLEIVRCVSGNSTYVYYKKSRPDIDNQRVRIRYEELVHLNLHKSTHPFKPYSLDQHDHMHWGEEIRRRVSYDKDGFPIYEQKWWQFEEILSDDFSDGPAIKGFKTIQMPNN